MNRLSSGFNWIIPALACGLVALLLPPLALVNTTAQDSATATLLLRISLLAVGVALLAGAWIPAGGSLKPESLGLRDPGPLDTSTRRWLLLILAAAAGLRLLRLDGDLWVDEVVSAVNYFRLPLDQIVYTYLSPNQHTLYSLLAHISTALLGWDEWVMRLPSVLLGVGSIAALFIVARLFLSDRDALLAAALLALSYHHVWFSQNARGYTGMLFWTLLATYFFLRGLRHSGKGLWLAFAVCTALAHFTLQNAAFVTLGLLAAYALVAAWRAPAALNVRVLWAAGLAAALTLLCYSLSAPKIIGFFATEDRTGLGAGLNTLLDLVPLVLQGLQAGFLGIGLVVVGIVVLVGGMSLMRRSLLVALLMALPPVFGLLAVILLNYGAFPRAFLYVLPWGLLLAILGVQVVAGWFSRRAVLPAALAVIALSSASLVLNYRYPKQDYTGARGYVEAQRGPGDVVAAIGMAAGVYERYYDPALAFPQTVDELAALEEGDGAVWVIYSFPRDMRLRFSDVYDYVEIEHELVASFPGTLGDGTVYVTRRGQP